MAEHTAFVRRITSNSRGPGQDSRVRTRFAPRRICEACGGVTTEAVMPGRHSVRWNEWGELVDCVGAVVQPEGVRR